MRLPWPHPRYLLLLLLFAGLAAFSGLPGCVVVGNLTQLDDDHYQLVRRESPDSLVAVGRTFAVYSICPPL